MKLSTSAFVVLCVLGAWAPAIAQTQSAVASGNADLYHVHFTKAAPGQAAALGKGLMTPDPTAPMPDHFVVLRHQEGDDWDYAVIEHLGPKAAITAGPAPANPTRDLRAWHTDTFVTGPSWAEFTKAMGPASPGAIYVLGIQRPVPGHREELRKALSAPGAASKIETGNVLFEHVEGGDWTYLTITRYNSWQDLGTDRGAAADPNAAGSWADIRNHSAFHRDTIADRIK
jgi:hypothetical protein